MGLDWDRVAGQGGAYLVERAAAVQQSGRLSPLALALVEEEARRLKYILDEEIGRLQPTAELTPAAIEALRAMYQDRLDKAEHVLETARVTATRPQPPSQPQPPPQPSPASGGGRIVGSGGVGATPPTQPSAAGGAGGNVASGGGETRGRSFREFIAERSILILSYIGAFLLIVATLLFELDTFVALNGTARFIGVLALNVVFAVAGWICFRLPVMRLVGRTYIAIAALMFPLTLIAAWVFLLLADYGIHRDVAVALAGTACALVYGLLAVVLGSRGYSLLSLIALAVAWVAGIDILSVGRWSAACLTPLAAAYFVIATATGRFKTFNAVFKDLAGIAVHAASAFVLFWTLLAATTPAGFDWPLATAVALELTVLYVAYAVVTDRGSGGVGAAIAAAVAMAFFGVAWVCALNIVDLEPLTGLLLTPLIGVYTAVTYRAHRIRGVGMVFRAYGEPFIHLAALLALLWTAHSAGSVIPGAVQQAWLLGAASLAVVALIYAWFATLSARRYAGLTAMISLGLAWFCLLNGVDISPWQGLAFTPLMAFYIAVASRRPVIRDVFASEPEVLITGAAGIAAAWSIYFTATAADLRAAPGWYPLTLTLIVIAILYLVDTGLRRDMLSPSLSLGALVGAWIAESSALQLGDWRGLALTPLAFGLVVIAFRGNWLGPVGAAFARWADPFTHAVSLIAIGWSAFPAMAEAVQGQAISSTAWAYLAWTVGAVTLAYALYCWLSKRQSMQWTVAIGITLTTVTANQALSLTSSALAIELLALAIGKAVVARLYRGRMHTFLHVTAAVQAVLAGIVPVEQDWLRAVILVAAAAMAVLMALDADRPEWLYLAGAFFTYGWYWLLKVVVPPPANPGPSTLLLIFSPLPAVYAAVAIGLHRFTSRRWRWPLYVWAGVVAIFVVDLGAYQRETTILGFALLAYSAAIYWITAQEDVPGGIAASAFTASIGLLSLLFAASAAPGWYPLAFSLLAWAIYLAAFLWTTSDRREWARMHRNSGLVLMGTTALCCFLIGDFAQTGSPAAMAALVATLALALMLAVNARADAMPGYEYGGLLAAAVGSYWVAHYFGAVNPQWYVFAPGLALIAAGVRLHSDRRFTPPQPLWANRMIAGGCAVLLGTSALQTLDVEQSVSLYTGFLLIESIAAILAGIGSRSRVLVLAGAAGAALASLRALVILIQEIPLFLVFGLVAILLLLGAAGLALLRARFADARVTMTQSWRDWS